MDGNILSGSETAMIVRKNTSEVLITDKSFRTVNNIVSRNVAYYI
jgi:hypothetical protein